MRFIEFLFQFLELFRTECSAISTKFWLFTIQTAGIFSFNIWWTNYNAKIQLLIQLNALHPCRLSKYTNRLNDFHRVNRVYHDCLSLANMLYLMWSPIQVKCLENQLRVTINVLLLAMQNCCMDLVDINHNRPLEQIQQQLVRQHDFLKFDLLMILMGLLHSYKRLTNKKNVQFINSHTKIHLCVVEIE